MINDNSAAFVVQMQIFGAAALALELDPFSWMKWAVQEMRHTWLTALTEGLVSTIVYMLRMQE